jgi:hypothetical protein
MSHTAQASTTRRIDTRRIGFWGTVFAGAQAVAAKKKAASFGSPPSGGPGLLRRLHASATPDGRGHPLVVPGIVKIE